MPHSASLVTRLRRSTTDHAAEQGLLCTPTSSLRNFPYAERRTDALHALQCLKGITGLTPREPTHSGTSGTLQSGRRSILAQPVRRSGMAASEPMR